MEEKLAPNNPMILEIRELLESARKNVAQQVNAQLLTTYWNIGRIIVEYEQQNQIRAEYGKQTLKEVSRELTREFGKGFSVSNIQFMRRFYQSYPIQQTASVKLSWSHYCELLSISDDSKRSFYAVSYTHLPMMQKSLVLWVTVWTLKILRLFRKSAARRNA